MNGIEIFVATEGSDCGSGAVNSPFATLERAREAARAQRHAGPVTVSLRGGDYVRTASLTLGPEDSGTSQAPVTYRAYPGETVRLLGGLRLNGFKPVSDPAVLPRLEEKARGQVLELDLRALGVTDLGQMRSRGFGRPTAPAHVELFFNDQPMTLARWPNTGEFAKITGFPGDAKNDGHGTMMGELKAGFFYEGDRPKRWAEDDDIWVHGYWAYDWANSYEKIAAIDKDKRHITTQEPYGLYAINPGQRIFFLNILEELDEPGEYYVDRKRGMLYFWPPLEPTPTGRGQGEGVGRTNQRPAGRENEILLSLLAEPLIVLKDASHVVLRGLRLDCTRGHGVAMHGGSHCLIDACTISNTGNCGAVIIGGVSHGVRSCHIYNNGDSGVDLAGGDRKTLTPSNHFVDNCRFHHQARWSRCYYPAVHLQGVGMRVSHNLMHDHPHCPLIFWGNDHVIEFNEIHHVCHETGDVGAIYTGRDWTFQGNIIRYNYFHDIHGPGHLGSFTVYLDDCVSGIAVYGNILLHTQFGVALGGGRDCTIENNIFIDTHPAINIDDRGLAQSHVWQNMVNVTMKERLEAMNHHQPPYATRFPQLRKIDPYLAAGKGVPPADNLAARNIFVGEGIQLAWQAKPEHLESKDNWTDGDPGWVNPSDPAAGMFALRADAPVLKLGFKPIPFEKIGLRKCSDPA